jgi:AraC-like DNA-binding protein
MAAITTQYVQKYQRKNIANGLCRACTKPLSEKSIQLCDEHLKVQRDKYRLKRGSAPRGWGRDLAVKLLQQNPDLDVSKIAQQVGISTSCFYEAFRALGLKSPQTKKRELAFQIMRDNPGVRYEAVAQTVGASEGQVRIWAQTNGFQKPPRKRRVLTVVAENTSTLVEAAAV